MMTNREIEAVQEEQLEKDIDLFSEMIKTYKKLIIESKDITDKETWILEFQKTSEQIGFMKCLKDVLKRNRLENKN